MGNLAFRIATVTTLLWSVLASSVALGGVGPDGFFTDYLVLGPYLAPSGDSETPAFQSQDFLCDGSTSEKDIVPADGLQLGFLRVAFISPARRQCVTQCRLGRCRGH